MSDTHIETKIKNINIDGVENCNLLCKLIIDYEPSKKCLVKNIAVSAGAASAGDAVDGDSGDGGGAVAAAGTVAAGVVAAAGTVAVGVVDGDGDAAAGGVDGDGDAAAGVVDAAASAENKTYLEYPPGSFMNYQNTSYEATRVFFFHPSRHTIDRERFDFEVNIYHGVFKEGEKQEGMVSHAHYKSDNQARTTYNRDYHYHDNTQSNDPHLDMYQDNSQKNLVSCILFNRDDHKGHHANVFFNQFVNHPEFKNKSSSPTELKINTHANWSLEDLLPKRRSFFLYDDTDKKNTYVVFDSINSIDHGILEILKNHKYAEPQEYLDTNTTVLYKNNIEVITDERYKADMRDQIKQLIGIHRTSMRISNPLGSADDYNRGAAKILMDSSSGGSHSRFSVEKKTAKELLDKWKEWGEGKNSDMTADSIYSSLEGSKITATDFKRDSLNKKLDNFEDVYQSMDQDYLDAIEKIFVTIYHPTLKEKIQINDEFQKIENIRKYIYQYNCIFLEQKKYVLDTTEIKKSELMFDKPFNSLHELLLNLNFYKYQEDKTISIVGYEGNFNIYKTPKTGTDDSNGPKYVPQGLFEAPDNISKEELDDKIILVEKVNIVEYKIMCLGNKYVFNQISDGAEAAVGFVKGIASLGVSDPLVSERFYFVWRYLINFQSTISYNKDRDILAYQSVIMDENLTVTENLDIFRDFETQPIVAPEYIDFQPRKGKIIYNLLKYLNGNDDFKSIKFRYGGDELDTTIDGDKCQEWNSNEVHHEGSALLSSHPTFPKEGKTFESLNRIEKEHLRNGLFDYTETAPDEDGNFTVTLKRHNKCRNPYNRKSGPWCYTANPKKRWAYCVEPDHQGRIAKFILLFTFVMCIILAYLMVKVIFRYEYFTKFMAALTGGQMGEGAGAGASAGAGGTPAPSAE